MKKILILTMLLFSVLWASYRWKTYTNSSYISDVIETPDNIFASSWGGLLIYDKENMELENKLTILDGLSDQELRCLNYSPTSKTLLIGTKRGGVNLYSSKFKIPIDKELGLPSNQVNAIAVKDSLLFIGTDGGLGVFKDSSKFFVPLSMHTVTTQNGLLADDIKCLAINRTHIYIGTLQGVAYANLDSLNVPTAWKKVYANTIGSNLVSDIATYENKIAIATRDGLFVGNSDFTDGTFYTEDNDLATNSIYPVSFDNNGNLNFSYGYWSEDELKVVNSSNETYISNLNLTDNTIEHLNSSNFPSDFSSNITKIKNTENSQFICTWGSAFAVKTENNFSHIQHNETAVNSVTRMFTDSTGKTWLSSGYYGGGPTARGTKGVSGYNGFTWENYSVANSNIISDNIVTIGESHDGSMWYGAWSPSSNIPWTDGISIYNKNEDLWYKLRNNTGLYGYTITDIQKSPQGNTWVFCYVRGLVVYDKNFDYATPINSKIAGFDSSELNQSLYIHQWGPDVLMMHFAKNKVYFGTLKSGIIEMNFNPYTSDITTWTPSFNKVVPSNLQRTEVNAITSWVNEFGEEEIYFATNGGLYMTSNNKWYKFDVDSKRKIYSGNSWNSEILYFADENRIFSSNPGVPSAMTIDSNNNLWIGSKEHGITKYNLVTQTFENFTKSNSPLLSNTINAISYNKEIGEVFVGTDIGINSIIVNYNPNSPDKPNEAIAYPNPFYINKNTNMFFEPKNRVFLSPETKCNIYDLAGNLIAELEVGTAGNFEWDGTNKAGKQVASGVYFYLIEIDGKVSKGTISVIN